MDNEPEVTREQMQDTRTALSEKLETLEQQVVATVQGATNAVTETVENVKDAFNLPLQMKRHPWAVVAGSLALGYLGGYLLFRRRSDRPRAYDWSPAALPDSPRITLQPNGVVKGHHSVEEAAGQKPVQEASQGPSESGWLSGIHDLFGTEITQLKGLVIGKALGVVRDLITQSVPEPMKPQVVEMMDSITVKLGGEPIGSPVLKDGLCAGGEAHQEHTSSAMGEPLGATQRQGQSTEETVAGRCEGG